MISTIQQPPTLPVFAPASSYARSINSVSHGVLITALCIFLIVVGLVTYCTRKFRAKTGDDPTPKPIYGNNKLEVGYTLAFMVILAVISVFSIRAMEASDPPTNLSEDVLVIGHQWWWEIRYPKVGLTTANEIHIPIGQPEEFAYESADVIHDLWVPQLGRKMDIIPGIVNRTWLAADSPGTYFGRCAEYCGKEHAWMRVRVIAQSPDDFARWEQAQLQVPPTPSFGEASLGAQDFQQWSCVSCHTIRGTPAHARIGPDLTHFASRETIAAGRLENTPEDLAKWLLEPDLVKPGCRMPNLHLPRQQQNELVAYLETLQ